jgi:hypothetical protein
MESGAAGRGGVAFVFSLKLAASARRVGCDGTVPVMQFELTGNDNTLIDLLGKPTDSVEVAAFAAEFGPLEPRDAPPFRVYLRSPEKGIDLLIEHGRVLDVQLRVTPSKTYKAFSGALPFGLRSGMIQQQVHEALGAPVAFDEFDSRYQLRPEAMLIICYAYDGSLTLKQLHISSRTK